MTEASVPDEACTASGCHADHGPATTELGSVTFAHRDHGQRGVGAACAACHTHPVDAATRASSHRAVTLDVTDQACFLCHASAASGERPDECRICHDRPDTVTLTPQGTEIEHARFERLGLACTRCHHDVPAPDTRVAPSTCGQCHEPREVARADSSGLDLHHRHRLEPCVACHEAPDHTVRAMSSVVDLRCGDCHAGGHGLPVPREAATPVCRSCHVDTHADVQRYVLGLVATEDAIPSSKFVGGVTCAGCHAPTGPPDPTEPAARIPDGTSCRSCHPTGYDDVLEMWRVGVDARGRDLRQALDTALERLDTASDEAREALTEAGRTLTLIDEADGIHNLELTHRLFERTSAAIGRAHELAGVAVPDGPVLGPRPHIGACTYCHYDRPSAPSIEEMDPAIHARLDRHRALRRDEADGIPDRGNP